MTTVPVVGVDLVEVSRVARVLERHHERFLDRYFTASERKTCGSSASRLAARWAAKEACAKALGTGLGAARARDIEVLTDDAGAPHLCLHGGAAALSREAGLINWAVSLSHTEEHAMAVVVATRADKPA